MIKEGGMLAWKLCREGRFVDDIAIHSNVGGGLRVYRERRRGKTVNIKQTIVTQYMTIQ